MGIISGKGTIERVSVVAVIQALTPVTARTMRTGISFAKALQIQASIPALVHIITWRERIFRIKEG